MKIDFFCSLRNSDMSLFTDVAGKTIFDFDFNAFCILVMVICTSPFWVKVCSVNSSGTEQTLRWAVRGRTSSGGEDFYEGGDFSDIWRVGWDRHLWPSFLRLLVRAVWALGILLIFRIGSISSFGFMVAKTLSGLHLWDGKLEAFSKEGEKTSEVIGSGTNLNETCSTFIVCRFASGFG